MEPLLLLVIEPGVARIAGNRTHPRSALSPLRSLRIWIALAGTCGEYSRSSPSPSGAASPCTRRRLRGEELGGKWWRPAGRSEDLIPEEGALVGSGARAGQRKKKFRDAARAHTVSDVGRF